MKTFFQSNDKYTQTIRKSTKNWFIPSIKVYLKKMDICQQGFIANYHWSTSTAGRTVRSSVLLIFHFSFRMYCLQDLQCSRSVFKVPWLQSFGPMAEYFLTDSQSQKMKHLVRKTFHVIIHWWLTQKDTSSQKVIINRVSWELAQN